MSLLAARNISTRDAIRMLGWMSPEMIRFYEKELEEAKKDADHRALKLVNEIEELDMAIPEVSVRQLLPEASKEVLHTLVEKYSNVTIGKIYDVSETAVRKRLDKHGIVRGKRIEKPHRTCQNRFDTQKMNY